MHIAAAAPEYVSRDEVPADVVEKERGIQLERVMGEGKPQHIAAKIVDGRIAKWFEEICLLDQKFVKDDAKTVETVVKEAVATIGENIKIRRFVRYVMGEGLQKRSDDFAAEVARAAGAK
jgi:elongation factor Ts